MKILVACEFSGAVRDAFRRRGHEAWSCDLLGPDDLPDEFRSQQFPNYHLEGDVRDFLREGWDMMIAFPPCTHLANSGARWFHKKRREQREALAFIRTLLDAPIPRIALENPVGVISTRICKPDQIVQPWWFGDPHTKTTCLWLKNLPKLHSTKVVGHGRRHVTRSGRSLPEWYNIPPREDRARIRSRTFRGFAEAMAEQWGGEGGGA